MERKLSGPGGQGWDLSFMEKIPSAEPGGELSRCAVQARSQPVLPPGPSPEDKRSKGDSRTAHNGDPVTPSGPTLLCTWLPAARRPDVPSDTERKDDACAWRDEKRVLLSSDVTGETHRVPPVGQDAQAGLSFLTLFSIVKFTALY